MINVVVKVHTLYQNRFDILGQEGKLTRDSMNAPLSHMGLCVPQKPAPGQAVGMLVPAALSNRYQPSASSRSQRGVAPAGRR